MHQQLLHPSAEELSYTRRDRDKGCPREYTHIHMGVHEDIKERWKRKILNSIGIGIFSNTMANGM
jgi:hypothetical protein